MRAVPKQEPSPVGNLPACPSCGKAMRMVGAMPATSYRNLNRFNFECDCGEITDRLVADMEDQAASDMG